MYRYFEIILDFGLEELDELLLVMVFLTLRVFSRVLVVTYAQYYELRYFLKYENLFTGFFFKYMSRSKGEFTPWRLYRYFQLS